MLFTGDFASHPSYLVAYIYRALDQMEYLVIIRDKFC